MSPEPLATYKAKRNFGRTAEPSGEGDVAPAGALRFVVQKHDATRLHYDLRLEMGGVFKSWAVTRGPSLDPHDKRLAVEVEDHPLDYGDFEGTIPAGEYGGGTVQLWDRGTWAPEGGKTAEAALKSGDLKFTLHGTRLHGSWVLVRMKHDRLGGNRSGGKRTNWLLIKHADEHAQEGDADALLADDRSVASGRAMAAIAAGTGSAPKPFMRAGTAAPAADARWSGKDGLNNPVPEGATEPAGHTRSRTAKSTTAKSTTAKSTTAKSTTAKSTAANSVSAKSAASKSATSKSKSVSAQSAKTSGRRTGAKSAVTLPDFVPPQLCASVARPPSDAGWIHEVKFDGYRLQLRVEGGVVTLKTRKGLDWTARFGAIAQAAAALPDGVVDGEAVALDAEGSPDFGALQAALSEERGDALIFYAFDLLHDGQADLRGEPLRVRKDRLQALLEQAPKDGHLRYVEHFGTGGDAILKSACRLSLEGIVSKRLDAPYTSGRSDTWTKAKCRGGHEVVIGGWTTNGGQFRSLLAGVYREGRLVPVGRVGTGFGADTVRKLLPRLQAVASATSPFTGKGAPRKTADIHWARPDLVAEIEFAGWTADGLVRQGAFKGLRDDKPAREVEAEEPVSADDATMAEPAKPVSKGRQGRATEPATDKVEAASKAVASKPEASAPRRHAASAGRGEVMGVSISHADKPMWPSAGSDDTPVTKLDLARYLEAVGPWMMEHVAHRPCSIVRAPDGYAGEHFFQRHAMSSTSSLLELMSIGGDRKPYLAVGRVEGLAALAQVAALELHPSNCASGSPEVPGRLVFDLDPGPDVAFSTVVAAAKELKVRLEALGLVPFCKTTGGKGLHVVTPLAVPASGKGGPGWDDAKAFARDLCTILARESPDAYVVVMAKKVRQGKIFLDYLRNDRLATAVAPLSPRARPGALVSMPVPWSAVTARLDPARFSVRTAPALLSKTRPWADYGDAGRPLADAIKRLGAGRGKAA